MKKRGPKATLGGNFGGNFGVVLSRWLVHKREGADPFPYTSSLRWERIVHERTPKVSNVVIVHPTMATRSSGSLRLNLPGEKAIMIHDGTNVKPPKF